jgi:fucose 4-O-acetylase-like acetyltransferase
MESHRDDRHERRGTGPLAGVVDEVRQRAANTPEQRDRYADFLRAVAISVVVVGHWLAISVEYSDGRLSGVNALDELAWSHPLTWALQVMPVFFFVGGLASAASMASRRDEGWMPWLLRRSDRLLRPVTPFFLVLPVAAGVAVVAGVDTETIGRAAWLASIPLWFLLAFLVAVFLTPITYALHRRLGLLVPMGFIALVAVGDLTRLGLELPLVGDVNYVLGWLAIYQLGYCWYEGRFEPVRAVASAMLVGGVVATVLLTTAGPFPVRMVGANTDPPTVALMSLAVAQLGLVMLLRPAVSRWLTRTGPWSAVVAINSIILTLYVWHMTAAVITAAALFPTGVLDQPEVTSVAWLAWRVPWVLAALLVLSLLVAVFGAIEMRGPRLAERVGAGESSNAVIRGLEHAGSGGSGRWMAGAGAAAVLAGLLGIAFAGPDYHGLTGLPPWAVLSYLLGAGALAIVRRS